MIYWMHTPFMPVWWLFAIVFGILGIFLVFALTISIYVFCAYIFTRIGRKFNIGSFPQFLVPFYNVILLCDCAKVERWVAVGVVLPLFSEWLHFGFFGGLLSWVAFAANVYLWGSLAKRLGKEFWLWGIITPLLGWLPAIVLAFDSSSSSDGANEAEGGPGTRYEGGPGTRYIDIDM